MLASVRQAIHPQQTGYCIVRNKVLDAAGFMDLLNGTVGDSFTVSTHRSGQVAYDIVKDAGDYQQRKEGSIISASNVSFPLHTDCSFLERPADIVVLYCIENAVTGGESLLANVNQIIPLLPEDYISFLLTKKFYINSRGYPILEQSGDQYVIRFNLGEFLSGTSPEDNAIIAADLQPLTTILSDAAIYTTVKLAPDECLVVNNRTCLHGRHAFEDNSNRIFYRARHYWTAMQ